MQHTRVTPFAGERREGDARDSNEGKWVSCMDEELAPGRYRQAWCHCWVGCRDSPEQNHRRTDIEIYPLGSGPALGFCRGTGRYQAVRRRHFGTC
jgi:hypothetical protein